MAWRKLFIIIGWRRHSSRRLKNSPVGPSGFAIGGSIPSDHSYSLFLFFSSLDRSSSALETIDRCRRTTTDKRFPLFYFGLWCISLSPPPERENIGLKWADNLRIRNLPAYSMFVILCKSLIQVLTPRIKVNRRNKYNREGNLF